MCLRKLIVQNMKPVHFSTGFIVCTFPVSITASYINLYILTKNQRFHAFCIFRSVKYLLNKATKPLCACKRLVCGDSIRYTRKANTCTLCVFFLENKLKQIDSNIFCVCSVLLSLASNGRGQQLNTYHVVRTSSIFPPVSLL